MKNLVSFTYTKTDGSMSDREALIISRPSHNYAMLDLTDLDSQEVLDILARVAEFEKVRAAFIKTVPYKYFTDSKISNLIETT